MKVAILGLGAMGSAAAKRLHSEGFDLVLWNRTSEKAVSLAKELGVRAARDLVEALGDADAAVAFLADDDALISVASQVPRVDGLVFINSSTIAPRTASMVSAYLEGRGACYVEAPVIGGPGAVSGGSLIILASGKRACIRMARPVLSALGQEIIELGEDPEKAQALKLSYNLLLITSLAGLAEAIALADVYGIKLDVLKDILSKTVFSEFSEKYFDRLLAEEWPPKFRMKLAAKDLDDARRAAWARGLAAPVSGTIAELYKQASLYGYADEDYSRIYKFIRGKRGVKEGDSE